MEAAEDAAEQNAGPGEILGLMTEGRENYLIRDNRVNDLAQVRDQLRTLGDPRQMPVALREAIALGEHRLDADDQPQTCQLIICQQMTLR